uniref:uncharacterized protein isoform X1 n=1 Tax=Myxine glutinosa TaxID=7769 RepID=UPI00358F9B33
MHRLGHHSLLRAAMTVMMMGILGSCLTNPAKDRLLQFNPLREDLPKYPGHDNYTLFKLYSVKYITAPRGQGIVVHCCELETHFKWLSVRWMEATVVHNGTPQARMTTPRIVLTKVRQVENGRFTGTVNSHAAAGYQWGTGIDNTTLLLSHALVGPHTTIILECGIWPPRTLIRRNKKRGETQHQFRPSCAAYVIKPPPAQEVRRKPEENTYWKVARHMATVQNRTQCWMCMHLPRTSTAGIPMVVLPLSLNDLCSKPLDTKCISTTLTSQGSDETACKRVFQYSPPILSRHFEERPAPVWVKPAWGALCLEGKGQVMVGKSVCRDTLPADPRKGKHTLLVNVTSSPLHNLTHLQLAWKGENGTNTIPGLLTCMTTHLVAPHGTMFVCGNKAYPYLPDNWGGICYLGSVFPEMEMRQHLHNTTALIRTQRSTYWHDDDTTTLHGADWEKAVSFFFPWAGTVMNSYRIDKIALILERVANDTATAHDEMLDTVVHLRTMVMQNRVALDMLLAERGGVCGIIKGKCCTFIPDPSQGVSAAIIRLRESAHILTRDRMDREASHQWLTDWFKGWTGTIVKWILTALAIVLGLVVCCVLIKALVLACARKFTTGWTLKTTPEKAMVMIDQRIAGPDDTPAVNSTANRGSWNDDLNESLGRDNEISASEDCSSIVDITDNDVEYTYADLEAFQATRRPFKLGPDTSEEEIDDFLKDSSRFFTICHAVAMTMGRPRRRPTPPENNVTDDVTNDDVGHLRGSPADVYVSMQALPLHVSRAHLYVSQAHSESNATDPVRDLDPAVNPSPDGEELDRENTLSSESDCFGDSPLNNSEASSIASDDLDFDPKEVSLPPLDRYALFHGHRFEPADTDDVVSSPDHQHVRDLMNMNID